VLELKRSTVSVSEGIRQNLDNQKRIFIQQFFTTIQLIMAGNEQYRQNAFQAAETGRENALRVLATVPTDGSVKTVAETPVVLSTGEGELPHHDVLLNLGDEWPPFFASFERLLEIVALDDEDKQKARGRYRFYKERGYDIKVNPIEAERRQEA